MSLPQDGSVTARLSNTEFDNAEDSIPTGQRGRNCVLYIYHRIGKHVTQGSAPLIIEQRYYNSKLLYLHCRENGICTERKYRDGNDVPLTICVEKQARVGRNVIVRAVGMNRGVACVS